jgi:hypothetical protein
MPQFAFLFHDGDWSHLSPDEMQAVVQQYIVWVGKLRENGYFVDGNKLADTGRLVRLHNGAITDGPYAETKETIGGYFIIETETLEQAVELAKECPSFPHGGAVEVRPVDGN